MDRFGYALRSCSEAPGYCRILQSAIRLCGTRCDRAALRRRRGSVRCCMLGGCKAVCFNAPVKPGFYMRSARASLCLVNICPAITTGTSAALCHKTSWERIDKLDRHLSLLQAVVGSSISGVDDGSEAGGGADVAWSKALPCLRNLKSSGKTQPQDGFVEGVRGSLQRSIRTLENGSRRVDSARLEDL